MRAIQRALDASPRTRRLESYSEVLQRSARGTASVTQRNGGPMNLDAPDLSQTLVASEEDTHTIRELLALPDIREQWDQMIRVGGPITVATRMSVDGERYWPNWNYGTRTITIPDSYTGVDRASVLSFELHNAFNAGGSGINPHRPQHMSRDAYALSSEIHEYGAVRSHHENTSQGVEHFGWSPEIDRFRGHFGDPMLSDWNTPQGYVAAMDTGRPGSHTNEYRRQWDLLQNRMDTD
jgi:hypothetical protein